MKKLWKRIKMLWPLGVLVTVAVAIAAVPGIFSSVNSVSGYQLNGTAVNGDALCGSGTGFYDTPCSIGGFFYQTVASNGIAQTQRPTLNFTVNFTPTDTSSPAETTIDLVNLGTPGTYPSPLGFTVDNKGRVDAVQVGVTQANCLSVACAGGSTYANLTTYTNSSNYTVTEEVGMTVTGSCTGYAAIISFTVAGVQGYGNGVYNDCAGNAGVTFRVPPGATFSVNAATASGSGGTVSIGSWLEITG